MSRSDKTNTCNCSGTTCEPGGLHRRGFVQLMAGGAAVGVSGWMGRMVMAGPFDDTEYRVPEDKQLSDEWVRSLFARGSKEVYTAPETLEHIGMPIGGCFAGTVYLAGDGRLWLWDIFNRDQEGILPRPYTKPLPNAKDDDPLVGNLIRAGLNYLDPPAPISPFEQRFQLRIDGRERSLDAQGFSQITFDGRYPLATITYADPAVPIRVRLKAFSPFIPLRIDDSSLPATIMRFTVTNPTDRPVTVELSGVLENPVGLYSRGSVDGEIQNHVVRDDQFLALACSAKSVERDAQAARPDILFDDFERADYEGWSVTGDAFGAEPVARRDIPDYQGDVGGEGDRVVNSHSSAPGTNVGEKDDRRGSLTSREFVIARDFVQLYVGGGGHENQTCVQLIVDGQVVHAVTGKNNNRMERVAMPVAQWLGKAAQLKIVDDRSEGWGNIGVDHIVFTDRPAVHRSLETQPDFGTMVLGLVSPDATDVVHASSDAGATGTDAPSLVAAKLGDKLAGSVARPMTLAPGESKNCDFVLAWHFPNLTIRDMPGRVVGHHYASRFASATDVLRYIATHYDRLVSDTERWVETWYDATLPYWLLDRTMANTSILATTTCYRFADGRFWAWEGIGCCPGTCTHVWQYAQALARLFPEVEQDQRRRIDFGLALKDDGEIGHRAYLDGAAGPAVDGQCGRILGVYREHQMSKDVAFLSQVWPAVRRSVEWLMQRDPDRDGVLTGAQENTLDAAWYGKIAWISSLYLAALRAAAAMASEMGDDKFARQCSQIAERGRTSILETYNGEYFVQLIDSAHRDAVSSGNGCHIDQVFGQCWAHWVGLGILFDREKQLTALRSLWKYNFVPDIGPFREKHSRGRWYAMAGEAGLVMCTWPQEDQNTQNRSHWQFGYFNECMTGFEWQVASHMIWEGLDQPDLLQHGLAISRAIHDRYNGHLRNPYNEIECSDHYSRAMASYGVFQAVTGFQCHGPRGEFQFAPRVNAESFRAPFVGPEGWGTYVQEVTEKQMRSTMEVKFGEVFVRTLKLHSPLAERSVVRATDANGNRLTYYQDGANVAINFGDGVRVSAGQQLTVVVDYGS